MAEAPTSSRDFLKAARQRLTTAAFLLDNDYSLDAMYLAGYAIECGLKALIVGRTPEATRPAALKRISAGTKMHDAEVLALILRELGVSVPPDLSRRFRRSRWSVALRYATGRADRGEVRWLVKTAGQTLKWVEGQLP